MPSRGADMEEIDLAGKLSSLSPKALFRHAELHRNWGGEEKKLNSGQSGCDAQVLQQWRSLQPHGAVFRAAEMQVKG